jgi:hypothetical protein
MHDPDPQPAADTSAHRRDRIARRVGRRQGATGLAEQCPTGIGELHLVGGPVEEPCAEVAFQ